MTETGKQVELNDEQLDKVAQLMEKRALAEKQPPYASLMKPDQVDAMKAKGILTLEDVRAASDEDLITIKGIGLAAVQKLRDWSTKNVKKGDAIARRYLVLKCGEERLDVGPGDVIPERFGAQACVDSGKATWK